MGLKSNKQKKNSSSIYQRLFRVLSNEAEEKLIREIEDNLKDDEKSIISDSSTFEDRIKKYFDEIK